MGACTCAPVCVRIATSADRQWPGRSHQSDGCCASAQHHAQNPGSDHEADASGYAHAEDITHDLEHGLDTWEEADRLRLACQAGAETRVKYLISNRRICSKIADWAWRHYSGANDHKHHMHVSVTAESTFDTAPWFVSGFTPTSQPRHDGVTVPLPPALVTDYPGEHMQRIDVRIGLDVSGNGYTDIAKVKASDVVSIVVNGADPATAGGYPDTGVVVARCQVAGVTRVMAYNGDPSGAVDVTVWVAG